VETEEKREDGKKGLAHNLCYFPHLKDIIGFSKEMTKYIKNITLSTQHARLSGYELIDIVEKYNDSGELVEKTYQKFYTFTDEVYKTYRDSQSLSAEKIIG